MQTEGQSRHALPPGTVLNGVYRVEAELGQGGFGIVYRAHHTELDYPVAIKEYLPAELAIREGRSVHPRSADCREHFQEGMRRFLEEAKQLIAFRSHPNIVSCRDFFRGNGTAYLVMEYEEGLPLSELLRAREEEGRPFQEEDLRKVMVPLLEGLTHVHEAGVLHRDIKPGNILVRREDEHPVLIDFGAAKQNFAEHSKSLAPFTEGYAAIEQVGEGKLGPWTDLYGAGAVMWRMVAGGKRPYEPPNPVKVESRTHAVLRGESDPMPSARELGRGRFSERVLGAIDKCLELREADRVQDCGELLGLLRTDEKTVPAAAEPQPAEGAQSRPPGEAEAKLSRVARRSSRGLKWIAALAMLLLAAFLGLIFSDREASFRVSTKPPTARVTLMNSQESYRPGMFLKPGAYHVEVSAPSYETRQVWLEHDGSGSPFRIELDFYTRGFDPFLGNALRDGSPSRFSTEQACAWQPRGAECWKELANRPRCYVWNGYNFANAIMTVIWTGECSGGLAHGEGTLTLKYTRSGNVMLAGTGRLRYGKKHGHWVIRDRDGDIREGPYVDGKKHGDWVKRFADGRVVEECYVDGKQHGNEVIRFANGDVWEGPYAGYQRHGRWTIRLADGTVHEGPYVGGKMHGDWVVRLADGTVYDVSYRKGEEVSFVRRE